MPPTKRGIFHNLKESEYGASCNGVLLFFSSEKYLLKFLGEYKNNRKRVLDQIKKISPICVYNFDLFSDLSLYSIVEKRGFRAKVEGCEVTCEELQEYALREMTKPNSNDWSRIVKRK